jgi:hypothetical protein
MDATRCRRFFVNPDPATYHRQYEALRAVFVDGLPQNEVADRFGYTYGSLRQLVHRFRTAIDSDSPPPFFRGPKSAGRRAPRPIPRSNRSRRRSPTSEPARSRR